MAQTQQNYIVILCGGTGPRLWPISRTDHPKQFLHLFSQNSILKETFLRALKIVPADHIFVVSNLRYLSLIKTDLKGLVSPRNIISEPDKKNTALALIYAAAVIHSINPDAVIASFPSDHFIGRPLHFRHDIRSAFSLAAKSSFIVTLGIKPNSPSTSFGYISVKKDSRPLQVEKFIEKPPLPLAQKLIQAGNTFWNSGIYTFKISTLLSEFKLHAKEYLPLFDQLVINLNQPPAVKKIYSLAKNLPIDIVISEKSKHMYLIPASFSWNDIGEWKSIYHILPKTGHEFARLTADTQFMEFNSRRCLVSADPKKLIGLVGVNDLAVIDTPDALLICNIALDDSFHVRDLVSDIVKNKTTAKYFLTQNDQRKVK